MTRTGLAARLSRHLAEPFLQIHPDDADDLKLAPADLARINGPHGSAILRVLISEDAARNAPFVPMHWTGETAPAARVDAVVAAATDPVSGQPESKASVVAINRFDAAWYGFAVATQKPAADVAYWARVRTEAGWRMELASDNVCKDWTEFAGHLFGLDTTPQIVTDDAQGTSRLAYFDAAGRLVAALFVAPKPVTVARDHIAGLLGQLADGVLAARQKGNAPDPGPTVCSCMGVGANTILHEADRLGPNLDRVCAATGAGMTCRSCRPEITSLINRFATREAAE